MSRTCAWPRSPTHAHTCQVTQAKSFNLASLAGLHWYIAETAALPRITVSQAQRVLPSNMVRENDPINASFFVAADPSDAGCRATWVAVLKGSRIASREVLLNDGSGALCGVP